MNRNYSDISYAESPFGTLSEFMSKTFGWMFAGLLVTFLVGIGAVTTGLIYPLNQTHELAGKGSHADNCNDPSESRHSKLLQIKLLFY